MNFQLLPCPAQDHHDIVIRQSVPLGDVRHRLGEKVSAHEYIAVPLRQRTDKQLDALTKLSGLVFALHVRLTGKALRQFIQDEDDLAAATLFCGAGVETVERKIAGDLRQEHLKLRGFLRRHCVPCVQPGIIDALLGVLFAVQDIVRYGKTILPFKLSVAKV